MRTNLGVGRFRSVLLGLLGGALGCHLPNPEFDEPPGEPEKATGTGTEAETGTGGDAETGTETGTGTGTDTGMGTSAGTGSGADTGGGLKGCDLDDPNLMACYEFESAQDGSFVDGSGNGNHADASSALVAASPWGNGLDVAPLARVAVPDSASLDINGPMTLEGWLNLRSLPAADERQGILDNEGQYAVFIYPPDELRCQMGFEDVSAMLERTDEWIHFACVYDGTELRAYINARRVGTLQGSGEIPVSDATPMTVGNAALTYDAPLDGMLDRLRVWNAGLGDEEICLVSGVPGC